VPINKVGTGYQPPTRRPERRAFFDQLRKVRELQGGVDDLGTNLDDLITSSDDQHTHTAWGLVARAVYTTAQTGIGGTRTDLTGLSVTFTPVVNRWYRTRGSCSFSTTAALPITPAAGQPFNPITDYGRIEICDGATNLLTYVQQMLQGTNTRPSIIEWTESFTTTTPVTRKLTYMRTVGAGTVNTNTSGGNTAWITVEDIGPV
jgi:hypothetical protein